MDLLLLNRLSEWNPQLFRELKGLFKPRSLLLTVASSLVAQFLLLVPSFEQYCLGTDDCTWLEWKLQWSFVYRTLNWILPFLLLVGGVYLLLSNLGQEERRGTLNFIRLSPQSSQSILMGKLLGVPALLYLGVVLALPLHAVSALVDGLPLSWLLGTYILWGVGCCLFYSAAILILLNRSKSGVQYETWGGTLLASLLGLFYISLIDFSFEWYQSNSGLGNWNWFGLPVGYLPGLLFGWILVTLSVGTYWIWQADNRLFRNPSGTVLSKSQSYGLVVSFQLWLLGFVIPPIHSIPSNSQLDIGYAALFVVNPILFLFLNAALSPRRQTLQDWACYRRQNFSTRRSLFNHSLRQDLIWGEKSPALVAIAINLLMTTVIWIPWILLGLAQVAVEHDFTNVTILLGWLLTVNVLLLYAAIAQILLFMRKSQRLLWAMGSLGTLIGVPGVIGALMHLKPLEIPFLWLFSPLPVFTLVHASAPTILLGFLAQLSILGLLTVQLTRQLQKAGESASKALFVGHPSLPSDRLT